MSGRITLGLLAAGLLGLGLSLACTVALPPSRGGPETEPPPAEPSGPAPAAPALPAPAEGAPGTAAPPGAAATSPAAPPAASAPAPAAGPIRLRVGLATDLEEAWVPCCDEPLVLGVAERRWAVRSPLRVVPDAASFRPGIFRLQVAALKDEAQAAGLARRLGRSTGYAADYHFDAGIDLYRVRVGRFATREEADAAREHLAGEGVIDTWIVGEEAGVVDPALLLVRQGGQGPGETSVRLPGRLMSIDAPGSEAVPDLASRRSGNRFRGRLWLYLNDRGKLNLINEVDLDDYLRSVVASEMGPAIYGRLEALKAQAVAARTYTLRNLGEFREEGYDICATPRCQVYRGRGAEHPLSDRAVAETSGQVLLYGGDPIDARYSSSCGGHTEDVATIFPLEDEPYLQGVPCIEAGEQHVHGAAAAGTPFTAGLVEALLPAASSERDPRARLEARLTALARGAGLALPGDRLASLERAEVRRFVTSLFDLVLDRRLLQPAVELAALLQEPPRDWSDEQLRQATSLAASGVLDGSPRERVTADEELRLVLSLARLLHLVREETVHFLAAADGELILRGEGGAERRLALPLGLPTFERRGGRTTAADLALAPGDRLELLLRGAEPVALVQEVAEGSSTYRIRSRYASWRRFHTEADLARQVSVYYPGLGFSGLEILSRGVSGRVGKIRLSGTGGRWVEVEGLAVRWTLDIPDNRFEARPTRSEDGRSGWLFTGSGWGHGVGLCQIGAVNMAGRGLGYREILDHYYTGVELARVRRVEGRWERQPTPPAPTVGARR